MTLVHQSAKGTVTIPESVLVEIAARAAESVAGVHVRRKRMVDVEAKLVRLEIDAPRTAPLTETGAAVQDAVASALETMCGLAARVDVAVEELA
jgi:uncharacterized alkaline shock family protein YloU